MAKKQFIAHFIGEGDGCDYTIGCNTVLENLKATTLDEAKKEVGEKLEDFGADDEEADYPMGKVVIYEVAVETIFDLDAWLDGKQTSKERDEEELTESEERAMLQKLKNKYEKEDSEDEDDENK